MTRRMLYVLRIGSLLDGNARRGRMQISSWCGANARIYAGWDLAVR